MRGRIQNIVDDTLEIDVQPVDAWADRRDFSVDWLAGVVPITDVAEIFRKLEQYSKGAITREHFALSTGGLFNYANRLCYLGKFYFQIAYNPGDVGAVSHYWNGDVDRNGDPIIRGDDVAYSFPSMAASSTLSARERKDREQRAKELDDFSSFRLLSGDRVRLPLVATDLGNNPGVYLSITGQGCSVLRQLGVFGKFTKWLRRCGFKCSRIDFAFDVKDEANPLVPMLLEGFINTAGRYTPGAAAVCTYMTIEKNLKLYRNFYKDAARESWSLSFGKHSSHSGMFRMYDKYFELISKNRENLEKLKAEGISYWYRLEYEAHGENAKALFAYWLDKQQDCCVSWFKAVESCFSPRFGKTLEDSRANNPTHPVWVELRRFCVQQNDYFAQCSADELRDKSAVSYLKWCGAMRKSFYSILLQLLSGKDEDVFQYVDDGLTRFSGDTFLTTLFGDADEEAAQAFIAFAQQYRATHQQRRSSELLEIV